MKLVDKPQPLLVQSDTIDFPNSMEPPMVTPPIKDRRLTRVSLANVEMAVDEHGTQFVSATCQISLSGPSGEAEGPGANIFFGIPMEATSSLENASSALLERAHAILQRLAEFSAADYQRVFAEWRSKELRDREEAAKIGIRAETNL